jgi:uncharacterized protein YprB with RNaseH-like and TPR domain
MIPIHDVLALEAVRLGLLPPLDRALVVDTEFMTIPGIGRRIFAVGLGWAHDGHLGTFTFFPDSSAPLLAVGRELLDRALAERLLILTWCGTTADLAPAKCLIPRLDWENWRLAARALHIDVNRIARRWLHLGGRHLSLKNAADALGIKRRSRLSGFAAPRLYVQSCSPRNTWQRRALRLYLSDDVRLVYEVACELAKRLDLVSAWRGRE